MSDLGASAGAAAKEISHEKHCPADGSAAAGGQATRAADALGRPAVNRPPDATIGTGEGAGNGRSPRKLRPRRRQNQVIDCFAFVVAAVAPVRIGACIAIVRISYTDAQICVSAETTAVSSCLDGQKQGWRASVCCRAACTWRPSPAPNHHGHQTCWHAASGAFMRPATLHISE